MASVVHLIYRLETGGAERSLARLLAHPDDGVDHSVVCIGSPTPIGDEIAQMGIDVTYLGLTPGGVADLRQRLRTASIVQGWMYYGNLLASAFAPRTARVVWNVRSSRVADRPSPLKIRAAIWFASRLRRDAVIFNSQAGLDSHDFRAPKTVVIPNGVDTERFRPDAERRRALRARFGIDRERLVGLVGRFHPDKGIADFAEMASRLRRERSDVRFALIGTDMDTANLELARILSDQALTFGPAGSDVDVQLLGRLDTMEEVYPALDVLALPSYREGMPNVLLEAMACGVPCVASDVGDVRAILGRDERVCQPGDVDALTEGVRQLLGQSTDSEDRQRVVERYDMARCARAYTDLYRSLII